MAVAGTINVRLPEDLKLRGNKVLEREGVSTTQAIRRLYERLEKEQKIPDWIAGKTNSQSEVEHRRKKLRELAGCATLPKGFDARSAYRARQIEKHSTAGVRL